TVLFREVTNPVRSPSGAFGGRCDSGDSRDHIEEFIVLSAGLRAKLTRPQKAEERDNDAVPRRGRIDVVIIADRGVDKAAGER
ncbi:MAG: hypothetical protein AAFQ15_06555, partial [Pseudomonadota bacterium]